jgi:hypothetical protein
MPSNVIGGSNEFEDFWCHRGVTLLQCHKMGQQKTVKIWSKSCANVVNFFFNRQKKTVKKRLHDHDRKSRNEQLKSSFGT